MNANLDFGWAVCSWHYPAFHWTMDHSENLEKVGELQISHTFLDKNIFIFQVLYLNSLQFLLYISFCTRMVEATFKLLYSTACCSPETQRYRVGDIETDKHFYFQFHLDRYMPWSMNQFKEKTQLCLMSWASKIVFIFFWRFNTRSFCFRVLYSTLDRFQFWLVWVIKSYSQGTANWTTI